MTYFPDLISLRELSVRCFTSLAIFSEPLLSGRDFLLIYA